MEKLGYIEIKDRFIKHLKEHSHVEISSAPLLPENDPSLLFVNSGMFPLIPFLTGEKHPLGTRLANGQRCVRTNDIDDVGDTTHCTSFIMLGYWSLNDYFKEEAINITLSFFADKMGFDINNLYATVFEGNENAPRDDEAIEAWKKAFAKYGIDAKFGKGEKIQAYGISDNWWPAGIASGPCGPCTEIYYDTGKEACGPDCNLVCDCKKYVELGNDVFMQYMNANGKYQPLGMENVDFGAGLERIAMISQGAESVNQIDIFLPIYNKVKELTDVANLDSEENVKSTRIITDHIKAATWMIMDGTEPSNREAGYILRRIIRRSVRHARKLGVKVMFTRQVGEIAIDQFTPVWEKLGEERDRILDTLEAEERKFMNTLENGLKEFEKELSQNSTIDGTAAFKLYETYGFPFEITQELAAERGIKLDVEEFNKAEEAHKSKSQSAAAGFFKGGLADTSENSTRLHTATHLLLAALRRIVGEHVVQAGSNITPDRLRFDFPNPEKLTPETIEQVEKLVNEQIQKGLPVHWEEKGKDEALKLVPFAAFDERYGDVVKVYFMGDAGEEFSIEICNGPHVENTNELGKFKIVKEEAVSAGVRRIKAILE